MHSLLYSVLLAGGALAAPASIARAATQQVQGQIMVQVDGTEQGCVAEDFSWQVGVDCPTFTAEVTQFSQGKEFTLSTPSGWKCGTDSKYISTCGPAVKSNYYWANNAQTDLTDGAWIEAYGAYWMANGVPGSCAKAALGARKAQYMKQMQVQLVWKSAASKTKREAPSKVERDTCPTTTFVAATPTAVRVPPPSPTGGAFGASATGHLNVMQNGRKVGCIDGGGKWNKDQSKCAGLRAIWSKANFELVSGDNFCYFIQDEGNFFCQERQAGNYFYGKGSMLVNPRSPKAVPVGGPAPDGSTWGTTFWARAAPAGSPVYVFDKKQTSGIALNLQWETT